MSIYYNIIPEETWAIVRNLPLC